VAPFVLPLCYLSLSPLFAVPRNFDLITVQVRFDVQMRSSSGQIFYFIFPHLSIRFPVMGQTERRMNEATRDAKLRRYRMAFVGVILFCCSGAQGENNQKPENLLFLTILSSVY
jgi:hypothetical protein